SCVVARKSGNSSGQNPDTEPDGSSLRGTGCARRPSRRNAGYACRNGRAHCFRTLGRTPDGGKDGCLETGVVVSRQGGGWIVERNPNRLWPVAQSGLSIQQ